MPHTTSSRSVESPSPPRELLPLIVAVAGHRDLRLEDEQALEDRVAQVLLDLQGHARWTPLVLLSALAEGADRLVARVGLRLGVRLIVPMPKPRDVYIRDFDTEASRAEFESLMARADYSFEVAPEMRDGPHDDRSYERLIAYLAIHSQVVIALWDGVDSGLIGGTSNAVRFKLEGVPVRLDRSRTSLDPPDTGPVYHILTPRSSTRTPIGTIAACEHLWPRRPDGGDPQAAFHRVVDHIDAFNRDTRQTLVAMPAAAQGGTPLVPAGVLAQFGEPVRAEAAAFGEADALAQHFQRKTNRVLFAFAVLSFLEFVLFELYAYYLYDNPFVMLLYVAPVLAMYVIYIVAKRNDYKNKYLDYRALAEGLRVQWFWHIGRTAASAADHYLRKQRTELDWIRHALRVWHMRVASTDDDGPTVRERMALLDTHWVGDQAAYYARAARRDNARIRRIHNTSNRLYVLGMAIAVAHVGIQFFHDRIPVYPMLIAMSLVLIIAAVLFVYMEQRGYSGQAKQYVRMAELYTEAFPRVRAALHADDLPTAQSLVMDLGRETLAENGDWVMMHRERPLEVPKLG